ncbi:MAG: hypothetical protein C4527_26595 [Candidatus Omnitrophota bacterium]|jgi:hypothetical protein|nr:MAG: hypothetical protein C4527_26595 [Candidatus Omnitrophota bacterium]
MQKIWKTGLGIFALFLLAFLPGHETSPQAQDDGPILFPEPVWLKFERSGGFTGYTQTQDISASGMVMYNEIPKFSDKERVYILNPEGIVLLDKQLDTANFADLNPLYRPEILVANGYRYIIEFQEKKVEIYQEADIPSSLTLLIRMLEEVLEKGYLDPRFLESSVQNWESYAK